MDATRSTTPVAGVMDTAAKQATNAQAEARGPGTTGTTTLWQLPASETTNYHEIAVVQLVGGDLAVFGRDIRGQPQDWQELPYLPTYALKPLIQQASSGTFSAPKEDRFSSS